MFLTPLGYPILKFPTVAFPGQYVPHNSGISHKVKNLPNLVEFVFGLLLEGTDVAHREAIPEICPAEYLTMEVCENPSLPLQP